MTFPSKVQPAGRCFELQTLYGACRVFVLKSSKSQDILVKIGCFTQNGDLSNVPTHPPLRTYTNSSLASCILVQLSDLCNVYGLLYMYNTVSPIHVEGMPVTGRGGDAGVHRTSQIIIYKKSPKLLFASKASLKNWEFYVFLDKEIA